MSTVAPSALDVIRARIQTGDVLTSIRDDLEGDDGFVAAFEGLPLGHRRRMFDWFVRSMVGDERRRVNRLSGRMQGSRMRSGESVTGLVNALKDSPWDLGELGIVRLLDMTKEQRQALRAEYVAQGKDLARKVKWLDKVEKRLDEFQVGTVREFVDRGGELPQEF